MSQAVSEVKTRAISLWEAYSELLQEYPIRTNAVTSGLLCSLGDALAQGFEWRLGVTSPDKESYNYLRTARMAAWGTLIGGPVLAMWYRGLHTAMESLSVSYAPVVGTRLAWLAERTPAMSWVADLHKPEVVPISAGRMLLGKVVLDTTLFQAPFLNLYFGVMGALEGLSATEIYEKTKASFHRAWALCFLVWTPVQAVNLYFVPVAFQPAVVAAVNVGWTTTLSLLNHYHDYGSPRRSDSDAGTRRLDAQDSGEVGNDTAAAVAAAATLHRQQAAAAAQHHANMAAAWEVERSQLRARIGQLIAENRQLRMTLTQLRGALSGIQPPQAPQLAANSRQSSEGDVQR